MYSVKKLKRRLFSAVFRAAGMIAVFFLILCFTGSPGAAFADTKLMVVSDLHYLDPSLYRGSELFLTALRRGDGKIPQFGEELLSALYQEILRENPDALIVTGDLTFNGEKSSHTALAGWFKTVEDAGVPVWIIPGNHDINTASPVGFADKSWYSVEPVAPEDFAQIYADFMEPGDAGFCYTAKVSSSLWVAMTDVSWYQDQAQTFGLFTGRHAAWLENVLKNARDAGAKVITATHHSLLPHTAFSRESFLMFGNETMASLVRQYGVQLNLSGHLHIQHIARENGLADAALGAFCIWPHRYAVVTCSGSGGPVYESRTLCSQFLPDGFTEMSRKWFYGIAREKAESSVTGSGDETGVMADYAARFNLAYFSGTYRKEDPAWKDDPAYDLWENQPESLFWTYMKLVMNETTGSNLYLDCGTAGGQNSPE